MFTEVRRGVVFTVLLMLTTGGGYHVLLWGIGQTMFREQAEGSLIYRIDGTVLGSRLIARQFSEPRYFHPRPSAVDYNAAATGGSNYGPSNRDFLKAVRERRDAIMREDGVTAGRIPSEMVTMSGSGMDPDIPPAAAEVQVARVARARGVSVERVQALIRAHTAPPALGFLGRARVNVLELNLALDETFASAQALP
jgi:K+-transporting ATPase ATPase C chain